MQTANGSAEIGFELAPTSKMKLMDETFMAYRAFTAPREKLYVSYPSCRRRRKSTDPIVIHCTNSAASTGNDNEYWQ